LFSFLSLARFPYSKGKLWKAFQREELNNSLSYFLEHQFDQTKKEDQAFKAACFKHGKRSKMLGKHTLFLCKSDLTSQGINQAKDGFGG
jgi:hypothetical protein